MSDPSMPPAKPVSERTPQSARASTNETLAYLNWLFNPFTRLEVPAIYDLLATRALTERALYLNLGYWRNAESLDDASEALADLVANSVRLVPGDTLLDVGFGLGDQDIRWAERFRPSRILGFNITASQVAIARARVSERGLEDQVDLRQGSATAIELADESVDKVTALECAFHFHTRERFLREAFRVLRPGGRIAIADIIPRATGRGVARRLSQRASWRLVATRFAIPQENAHSITAYHAKLRLCGFEQCSVESIRNDVYAPLHHWLGGHRTVLQQLNPAARTAARFALRLGPESLFAGLDYVLVTAVKPMRVIGA